MQSRSFKIGWRKKAALFKFFDRMPFGRAIYSGVQRYITHTVPRRFAPTIQTAHIFVDHVRSIAAFEKEKNLADLALFEFGAGWDLYSNCVTWCLGADNQVVYDLNRWARPSQINLALSHLKTDPPPGAVRIPDVLLPVTGKFDEVLRRTYGINYQAPADAGETGLAVGMIDAVVSTSVLEHIPPDQIERILRECRRVLRPGGIMSHLIDYSDHYAHSDLSITPYNFLAFEDSDWDRFNPNIHFQNRLRHSDYRRLFEKAGFQILSASSSQPENARELLCGIELSPNFAARAVSELAPIEGHFIVRRP